MTTTRLFATGLVLVAALLGPRGVAAPTAHADDPTDDAFLAAVRSKGINYTSPTDALIAAHLVCNELNHGETPAQVASDVMNNSSLDAYHAGYFVGASIRAYCPKYVS